MNAIERGRSAILGESRMLQELADQLDASFTRAVELMAGCTGHVITSGVGTTGMIARRLAHLLSNVACPALFLHAGDSLHGSSGAVRPEDVLVLLSKSGETMETCKLAQLVAGRQAPIITLTARPESSLGRLSSVVLRVETPDEVDPYDGLMSVGSTLAMGAMCDALVFAVMDARQAPKDQFIHGHPGGVIAHLKQT
jgi:arabinose-5-phosphate isomerase